LLCIGGMPCDVPRGVGLHMVVATPGRLLDFINQRLVSFTNTQYLVLDEADRLLDMGFEPEVRSIIEKSEIPPRGVRRTLMFSATYPDEIQEMVKCFMEREIFIRVGTVGSAYRFITQKFIKLRRVDKKDKVIEILEKEYALDTTSRRTRKTIVFVERKRTAVYLADLIPNDMKRLEIQTTFLHSDLEQKDREESLRFFLTGACQILVATSVANRGLDIPGIDHIINFDLPTTIEEYVQRIGRTGRMGNEGRATSFYVDETDRQLSKDLISVLNGVQQEIPDWLLEESKLPPYPEVPRNTW